MCTMSSPGAGTRILDIFERRDSVNSVKVTNVGFLAGAVDTLAAVVGGKMARVNGGDEQREDEENKEGLMLPRWLCCHEWVTIEMAIDSKVKNVCLCCVFIWWKGCMRRID